MDTPKPATTSTDTPHGSNDDNPARWAGVDWSWSEHAVCVIDPAGAVLERGAVKHTAAGLRKLVTLLHRHQISGVAIERGDGPVVAALLAAGLTVFVIPARQISALRTRYSSAGNKDDRFDAYLLADVLRTDRARPRHLHPSPGPRAQPRPRRAGPGPRLAPDHLALLARPHLLRPGTPSCRARGP